MNKAVPSSPSVGIPDAVDILTEALKAIVNWKPEEYAFPEDWHEQIEACEECRGYRGHPVQHGICDTHRRPLWAREAHDKHQAGPARAGFAWRKANDALYEYAQAIEARRAATLGAVHESAVRQDAPESDPPPQPNRSQIP